MGGPDARRRRRRPRQLRARPPIPHARLVRHQVPHPSPFRRARTLVRRVRRRPRRGRRDVARPRIPQDTSTPCERGQRIARNRTGTGTGRKRPSLSALVAVAELCRGLESVDVEFDSVGAAELARLEARAAACTSTAPQTALRRIVVAIGGPRGLAVGIMMAAGIWSTTGGCASPSRPGSRRPCGRSSRTCGAGWGLRNENGRV